MSLIKRLAAGLTAAALAVSLTACGGDTTWVYKDSSNTVSSGLYLYYLTQATTQAGQEVTVEEKESIFDKEIDGKSASDWIKEEARKAAAHYITVNNKFTELGLELTEEDQTNIDSQTDYYYPSFDQYYAFGARGIGKDSYRESVVNNIKYSKIFDAYYKEGGLEEVPAADIKSFYEANYAKVKMISLSKTNSTTGEKVSEEEAAALKTKADGYLKRINEGGETIEAINKEYKTETLATGSDASEIAELAFNFIYKEGTNVAETVKTNVFETAQIGGPAITFEDDSAVYILAKYDQMADSSDLDKYTESCLQYMKADEYEKMVEGWTNDTKLDTNNGALGKYTPKKLDNIAKKEAEKAAKASSLAQ